MKLFPPVLPVARGPRAPATPLRSRGGALVAWLGTALSLLPAARAEWQRTEHSLAWQTGGHTVWRFSFDPAKGKPFFDPVTAGGPSLTNFKPEDHPWHYGLWFSWKYINRVNYWEESRQTGRAEGATRWTAPEITARPDGGAAVRLTLTYTSPAGQVDLTEVRDLVVSAPAPDGGYTIDWHARFTAGPAGALLDRTPMPGEPKGQVNGGYAGLSIRMANAPLALAFLSTAGPVTGFVNDRARPAAPAVACNFSQAGRAAGGVAILNAPENTGGDGPWYLINSTQMRFVCAAILASQPRAIPSRGEFDLRYRIAIRPEAWTPATLQDAWREWRAGAATPVGRNP